MCIRGFVFSVLCAMATCIVMLVNICESSAALIAYEGYQYAIGSNIVGENGGNGWANAWSGTTPSTTVGDRDVQAPGAAYPNLATSGNKAFISATNQTQRTLSDGVQGLDAVEETIWLSFIGQRTGPNNIRFFGISFYQGTTDSGNERFTIGEPSNDADDLWGAHFTSTAQGRVEVAGASINSQSLLLARIDYHANVNDDLYLWVNPDLSLGEPALGSADASSLGMWNLAFDILSTRAGTTSGGNHGAAFFDEIRIGSRFSDVVPEPASIVIAMLGMASVMLYAPHKHTTRSNFRD
jgi:hypothetical protein